MPESFAGREGSPDQTPVSLEKRLHGKSSGIGNGARRMRRGRRRALRETYVGALRTFGSCKCPSMKGQVKTPSGYRNIEDVRAGGQVLSYNEHTKRLEGQTVAQTFIRKTDRIHTLVYDTGTKLQTTATHPFYIEGKGWVKAADLHVDDDSLLAGEVSLLDIYGGARLQNVSYRQSKQGVIVGITVEDRAETVYNFEVGETHTYLVGESDVVVHNDRYSQESKTWFNGHSKISYRPSGSTEMMHLEKKVGPGGQAYFEGKKGDRYITLEVTDGDDGLVENEWEINEDGSRGKKIPSGRDAQVVTLSVGDADSKGETSWNNDTLRNISKIDDLTSLWGKLTSFLGMDGNTSVDAQDPKKMDLSLKGKEHLKGSEQVCYGDGKAKGTCPGVYLDPAKLPTAGVGLLLENKPYASIEEFKKAQPDLYEKYEALTRTYQDSLNLYSEKLGTYIKAVQNNVKAPLEPHQFDALVSLTYNIGPGSGITSFVNNTGLDKDVDNHKIYAEMMKRVYSRGEPMAGLIRRRLSEWHLFRDGNYDYKPEYTQEMKYWCGVYKVKHDYCNAK